jgi:hypothetical protein
MSNAIKFLLLTIFIVAIWSVNSFLLPKVSNETKNINIAKRELSVKQSFNDSFPVDLSTSANEFVLKRFDKNQLVNNIDSLAQKSGIRISTLDIQINNSNSLVENSDSDSELIDEDLSLSQTNVITTKTNTLKSVSLNINIKGNKISLDSFLSELVNSKQYIDIQNINFSYSLDSDFIVSQEVESTIVATIYYVNL